MEGTLGIADLERCLDAGVELVREGSLRGAMARLEGDAEFSVVLCDEQVGGAPGVELLGMVRALAPTTVRLLVGGSAARDAASVGGELVFRCIAPQAPPDELRCALADALDYHQLLVTSPAQPVEVARPERDAMLPPANPAARFANGPLWEAAGPIEIRQAQAVTDPPAPEFVVFDSGTQRVGLQVAGRFVELLPGSTVVGRSRTCHISLPDPQVSRRHATFANTGREVAVRNVSQTNGVRINGILIERDRDHALKVGDRIMLGSHEIELCALGDYCPSFEPTDISLRDEVSETPNRSTLLTLGQVAEKYFVLGQTREAERILRPLLLGLLRHCSGGRTPSKADVQLATELTLRIADSNHAGEWIDYLFQLYTLLERPLPTEAVERLYRIIPESQGVKMTGFRAYLDVLARVSERLGPQERFLVRRIQGLNSHLLMTAHL